MGTRTRHLSLVYFFTTAILVNLAAPRPAYAQGDLIYHVAYSSDQYVSGWTVGVEMFLSSEGVLYDYSAATGYEFADTEVETNFPARTTTRGVSILSQYYYYYPYWEPTLALSDGPSHTDGVTSDGQFGEWIYLGSLEDYTELPGAGPPSVKFVFDGFIDHDWMGVPADPFDGMYDAWILEHLLGAGGNAIVSEADNRSFERVWDAADHRSLGKTSRFNVRFEAKNTAYYSNNFAMGPLFYTVLSETFEAVNSLDDWANSGCWSCVVYDGHGPWRGGGSLRSWVFSDWDADNYGKLRWGHASDESLNCSDERLSDSLGAFTSSLRITCSGAPYFPLHSIGSLIAVDFNFTLTLKYGFGAVSWKLEGCHDAFPLFSAYIGESVDAYTGGDTYNPFGMFGGCAVPIDRTGLIFYSGN